MSWALAPCAIFAIALAYWAVFGWIPLDTTWVTSLIYGDQLFHGEVPDYEFFQSFAALTPHPLLIMVGGVASLLGVDAGYDAMRVLSYLSVGGLVWALFRLGQFSFWLPAGVLGALAVATNPEFLSTPLSGTSDTPYLALVVFAAALEAERPRRGAAVLVVLALAGLVRPEAWLLAGAYWLYIAGPLDWPDRIRLGLLALLAPAMWLLSDLVVTGEPLRSLTHTREGTILLERTTGVENVPASLSDGLRYILRPPELIAGAAGFGIVLLFRHRRSLVPAAVLVLTVLGFAALGVAELPLLERYLLLPAAMLSVLFGFAVLGWHDRPPGALRRVWLVGGVGMLATWLVLMPSQLDDFRSLDDRRGHYVSVQDSLRTLAQQAGRLECSAVYAASGNSVPHVAQALDQRPVDIAFNLERAPASGVLILPRPGAQTFVLADERQHIESLPLPGYRHAGGNEFWILRSKGC